MLGYVRITTKTWYPTHLQEWKAVLTMALLNITIYGACFIWSIQEVAASIGSLSLGVNPIFIAFMATIWIKRPISFAEWIGMLLGIIGIFVASYPFLQNGHATLFGICLLLFSRFTYSVATIYFGKNQWTVSSTVVNAWQTLLGGALLLPIAYATHVRENQFTFQFFAAIFWLIVPIAIVASQLWIYLIKQDPVKASFWLFLCPVTGICYAAIFLHEQVSWYTLVGGLCVLAGVYLAEREKRQR